MTEYTVAVCNYNMSDTLRRSLTSILEQIDDRFELLVVDDGSTDSSPEILHQMSSEHESLRTIRLSEDETRHLGKTRNISVKEAEGDHVILHLDADDEFPDGAILDLVDLYEQIMEEADSESVVVAAGATIASRDFLLSRGPYRNLPVGGEDLDLWRRLLAKDEVIWIDSENMATSIGYSKDFRSKINRWYRVAVSDFQVGLRFDSYLAWAARQYSLVGFCYFLLMLPVARIRASFRESYRTPKGLRVKGARWVGVKTIMMTLNELETYYDCSFDTSGFSDAGRRIFFLDSGGGSDE